VPFRVHALLRAPQVSKQKLKVSRKKVAKLSFMPVADEGRAGVSPRSKAKRVPFRVHALLRAPQVSKQKLKVSRK